MSCSFDNHLKNSNQMILGPNLLENATSHHVGFWSGSEGKAKFTNGNQTPQFVSDFLCSAKPALQKSHTTVANTTGGNGGISKAGNSSNKFKIKDTS